MCEIRKTLDHTTGDRQEEQQVKKKKKNAIWVRGRKEWDWSVNTLKVLSVFLYINLEVTAMRITIPAHNSLPQLPQVYIFA